MRVVGTAGHVDHGKSTLVKSLTGIDPDRLKEEKEREMTIDLGFAWLTLPSGMQVSIVDVPGHEAFIKNMLAGVGGIDAALFVIAADEGVMPQTREHLAILDLLQVKGGVVALTKSDLVDADWIEMVTVEVRKELGGTVLAGAQVIPVSSRTRQGLNDLLNELDNVLKVVSERGDIGKPRLPIDRVFSVAGFGTVVTGTLVDGSFQVGQEIDIVPGGKRGRIRGLQTHKEKLDRVLPGSRVAINLAGLAVEDLSRGQVVASPGALAPTTLINARVRYLGSAPKPLAHNTELDFFSGSTQVAARVRLLDHEELKPGEAGWVQLHLANPVALAKNDRFILRIPSPSITVGGGTIVEPHAQTRHRRFRPEIIGRLETLARGTPEEIIMQFLASRTSLPSTIREISAATGLGVESVSSLLEEKVGQAEVIAFGSGDSKSVLSVPGWRALVEKIAQTVSGYHRQFPLRAGLPREELKSRLGFAPRIFEQVIEKAVSEGILVATEDLVRRPDFAVTFGPDLQRKVNSLLSEFEKSVYAPPSAQEVEAAIGSEALGALIAQGKLVRLNESVVFGPDALNSMRDWVVTTIRQQGQVTAGQVRDQFGTSRKYAIALLEYLDDKRITKRVGDARVLR